jgi:hypothetical protein
MGVKKIGKRFSIVFNEIDPQHLQVIELLNKREYRGKAQYIVNAVLQYENGGVTPETQLPSRFDEIIIEAVVNRLLRDRTESGKETPRILISKKPADEQPQFAEEIDFDEAIETLGEDGINAIADAMEMFRSM